MSAPIFTIGRICYKTHGRDAGAKVLVVGDAGEGFVMVEGARIKKGKCNVLHLMPTAEKVTLNSNYSHEDVQRALKSEGAKA